MYTKIFLILIALVFAITPAISAEANSDFSPNLKGLKFNGLFYLAYQAGKEKGDNYSRFFIHRAYLTAKKELKPGINARITFDTNQDGEGDGAGDMEVRLKYAFADVTLPDFKMFKNNHVEFGIVHAVWLDFEEHINHYRMISPMFMERSGIFNSADFGATFSTDFGEKLPEDYRKNVAKKYAGKWGGMAIGVYNGGGYHSIEVNENKVVEGRLTLRPFACCLPGFQVSTLFIYGKGNQSDEIIDAPLWQVGTLFMSYQSRLTTATLQYTQGWGNQKGKWTTDQDKSASKPFEGWAYFQELKLMDKWRLIGGYDFFDINPEVDEGQFERYTAGIGYEMHKGNYFILDYNKKVNKDQDVDDDYWFQFTYQLKF